MSEQPTGTTPSTTPDPQVTQTPPVVPASTEQGTAGAPAPAPSKKEGEQTDTPATSQQPQITPEEARKRIDRMYARLQEERRQRLAAETQLSLRSAPQPATTTDEDDGEPTPPPAGTITKQDVEAIVERRELEKRFIDSEKRVFEAHPSALNEDGSFNMSDPFVQKYIEIGKKNPMLAMIENGPELAAAFADKEMGTDFRKGRTAEAQRLANQPAGAFTTSSTAMTPPVTSDVQLTDGQKRVARRMGMTDKEYIDSQSSSQVKQKSWEVKPR